MKQADDSGRELGGAGSVKLTGSSTTVNVEEYAASPTDQTRTGFPKQGGQSLSHWLQQVRSDPLLDHRTADALPQDADTVIIGSGITGTLAAREHLSIWPEKSVVILEAREFCSGATGRNAGHCKPDQWRGFGKFEKVYGKEQAIKILNNEADTWNALVSYVRDNNVECDLWVGDTLDVPVDDEVAKLAKEIFDRYKDAGGKIDHIKVTQEPAEAARISRIKDAKACYAWQASTLQPWKLTAHVMRKNLENGANLQTYTVAKSVTESADGRRRWVVHSERGDIACDNVIHATNAYSAALEPALKGIITPKPHICTKVVPPRAVSGSRAIRNSYGVLLPGGGLFSINPRCNADGNVMFGGSNPGQQALDEWVEKHPENCINDGLLDVEGVTDCVKGFINDNFEGWGDAEYGPGEGIQYSWSGIIGLSADGVPFVGELPDKPGQWICAGHHGHGMARTFTAAPAVVKLMSGQTWESIGLPDVYQVRASRLEKLKKASASKTVEDDEPLDQASGSGAAGKPIQVGIIGAGKFGSMYISQSHRTKGVRLAAIADLAPERALNALKKTGFPEEKYDSTASLSIEEGLKQGKTAITTDCAQLIANPGIDVILEVTGNPAAGVRHALLCCEHKKHIVMINVEADVLAGPLLTRKALEAGIIYSMAYGDQPALIAEMVDWARTAGFDVVCAGKGTKHLPQYHYSTPDTVWDYYGFTKEQLVTGDFNKQMFNSFLDGTKSALEMAAVANGCDLSPPSDGLAFPPCGTHDLPEVLKPRKHGGQLETKGMVEVVSCLEKDGRAVFNDLRWGVYVVIEAPGEYQRECFKQYGLKTDSTGWYAAQYKPYHLIGLELGISVATIMVRGEPTGQCQTWSGDVVATAKRDLKAGEKLDGEGGFMVYGKLMTAVDSLKIEGLPIGLAHGIVLKRDVKQDQGLSWGDVEYGEKTQAVAFRREMEAVYREEFRIVGEVQSNGTNGVRYSIVAP